MDPQSPIETAPQMPFWLAWSIYGWPVILVVQLVCLVHIVRTGRPYWWFWIIMGFPLIGMVAYVFLEMRPTWGKVDFATLAWRFKSAAERIRFRQSKLDESPTIRNRMTLADELHADRQFDRECELLADGLRGPFRDDTDLLLKLSEAHLEAGRVANSQHWLEKCVAERSKDQELQFQLMKARILSHQDRFAEAEALFQELINRRRNEAPRYYYAVGLHRAGRTDEAKKILDDICKQYRRGTPVWRFHEKQWFLAAKQFLRAQISR